MITKISQMNSIEGFFRKLTSTSQQTLNAPALLSDRIRNDPQFLPAYLEMLAGAEENVKENELFYFHSLTLLHPILIDAFTELPVSLQEDIRSGLLSAVVALHPSLRTVAALALLIREILEKDSLQPWIEPLGELVKWSASDDVAIMHAGIEFFLYLLKETNYTRSNSDLPLYRLAPVLLENLFQVFAHTQLSETMREKLLYLVLQLVKTFSMLDGVQDDTVRQCFDDTFELWMSIFVSALQGSIHLNLGIKKYIVKILVVIFRDMQRYLSLRKYHQPAHLYVVWEFSYKILPLYLWSHVWDRPVSEYPLQAKGSFEPAIYPYFDDDSDALCTPLEALAHSVLQYLSVLTSIPQLQNALRLSTHHLTNALFHYMLMSQGELKGWKGNAHHFTGQGSSMDYELTVRSKCIGILNELIQKFGDLAIQAVLVISQKFLLNIDEESTSTTLAAIANSLTDLNNIQGITGGLFESQSKFSALSKLSSVNVKESLKVSGESWRKVEVSLLVLGRFSEDIIVFQSKQGGAFDIETFVRGIVRQVKEEDYYSLLKGQSLYCLTRFTEIISIKYRYLFGELITAAASCNNSSSPLPLRVVSCKALSMFLKKIEKHKLELTPQQLAFLEESEVCERIVEIPLLHETIPQVVEVLIEVFKNRQVRGRVGRLPPDFFLALFHQCLSQHSLVASFVGLLENVSEDYQTYSGLVVIFAGFSNECLKAFNSVLRSQQKKFLKPADTELILTALRVTSVFIERNYLHEGRTAEKERIVELVPVALEILDINEDVQVQVALSLYLKGTLRIAADLIAQRKQLVDHYVNALRILLRIPKDKSFESASIYAGNLIILVFDKLLRKNHNQILQEIVLKVFRSRTPSVIQSLVLVYARLINQGTTQSNKFKSVAELQANARNVVDFLSSFSIENRMGLKILIDKWLLQQSLFRGKFTKIATFMALSKLFLLSDKRVDNLLVIGFNPSHTNVNNDVTAPLKILATLIRCLDNELAGSRGRGGDSQDEQQEAQMKEEGLQVNLEKFKEEQRGEQELRVGGGLADRQNQQGSTCYMSAMLQFYDDGEQCDDKTEQDLVFLKDTSTNFTLSQYLTEFFQFLSTQRSEYLKECLKGLLLKDTKTLQKYIKI